MRAGRIELPPRAWQARVLPINYARLKNKYSLKIKNYKILCSILELVRTHFAAAGGEEFPPRKFGKAAEPPR